MALPIIKTFAAGCSAALLLVAALPASAVSYDFSTVLPSSATPSGSAPYARLTVTQDGPGKVDFRFEALDLGTTEFISFLKFNVDGVASSPSFTVSDKVKTGSFGAPEIVFKNEPKTDASLKFDVFLNFSTSSNDGGAKRFTDGDIFEWTLSRAGFSVADVDLPAMIHLQGIAGDGSAKITATEFVPTTTSHPVPDRGMTLALLGAGLIALAGMRRSSR